jgi:hypothetical protein
MEITAQVKLVKRRPLRRTRLSLPLAPSSNEDIRLGSLCGVVTQRSQLAAVPHVTNAVEAVADCM